MDDEIREISKADYEKIKEAVKVKRYQNSRIAMNAARIADSQMLIGEEGLEIGAKAWEMRKKGWNLVRISRELGVPHNVLDDALKEFEARVSMEAGRLMTHLMTLDMERIEDGMAYWMPIATGGPINIQKVRDGEVFAEMDFDRPLKASYYVLHAIQLRLKMLLAMTGRAGDESPATSQTNIMVWLQQVLPGVTKAVEDARGGESLVLETRAERENL
jgi:hypothetical protein